MVFLPPFVQHQQTMRALVQQRPRIDWPADWKQPERPEQEHPSHEDHSPVFVGIGAANVNTNVSSHVIVTNDSGATGNPYTSVGTTWLQVGPYLPETTRDLAQCKPLIPPCAAANITPYTKKHLANPSTQKSSQAHRGRSGRL